LVRLQYWYGFVLASDGLNVRAEGLADEENRVGAGAGHITSERQQALGHRLGELNGCGAAGVTIVLPATARFLT
jgi:hypothetical protein